MRRIANRRLPLVAEMAFLALVITIWQIVRIPLEGTYSLSLAHARDWLAIEQALNIDLEAAVLRWAHDVDAIGFLRWSYYHLHLPLFFAFMAMARQLRPERYPFIRTAFVFSHVPAILVIGLYPLLPPRWFPGMPHAIPAPDDLNGALHNATAAAASQHVGYPILIAASIVSLAPRSPIAWLSCLYPAFVFLVVVGTGNHYTLDAIVGGLCVAFGFTVARIVNGRLGALRREPAAMLAPAVVATVGYAFVVRAIDTASSLSLPPNPVNATDLLLLSGTTLVVTAWWWSRGDPRSSESWERPGEPQPQDARSGA